MKLKINYWIKSYYKESLEGGKSLKESSIIIPNTIIVGTIYIIIFIPKI